MRALALTVLGGHPDTFRWTLGASVAHKREPSAWQRALVVAGGVALSDLGAAAVGGMFGLQTFVKTIAIQFALATATILVFGWNRVVLIAAMLGSAGIRAVIGRTAVNKRIKQAVADEFQQRLRDSVDSNTEDDARC
jgi:hypothetical protein